MLHAKRAEWKEQMEHLIKAAALPYFVFTALQP
jgi:hypothetical protein